MTSSFPTFADWLTQHLEGEGPVGRVSDLAEAFCDVRWLSDAIAVLRSIQAPWQDFDDVRTAWRAYEAERSQALSPTAQPLPETEAPACTCRSAMPGAFVVEREGCPVHSGGATSPSSSSPSPAPVDRHPSVDRRRP